MPDATREVRVNRKEHWETVYRTKRPSEVSWYQAEATLSLRLIREVAPGQDAAILDVGGGASVLTGQLALAGYSNLTVLDLSGAAIAAARSALGVRAAGIRWIESDILAVALPAASVDLWHDRAVFHFLTDPVEQAIYVRRARQAVRHGGHLLVATFAEDGPTRCSGLDVRRYSAQELRDAFADGFAPVRAGHQEHGTPSGTIQAFTWCLFRRSAPAG
ncbi:MAG: class I SAM-dependent methyltransferase [Gemmatimonadales bacterium]|nr:class I SAM-dependent methyltransferase [Gemmatimonadales bacterium]